MRKVIFMIAFISISLSVLAQDIKVPRPSPDATVTQIVGVTEIKIDYSSPGVKGRKIWGDLVPFGEVWRTGANEVTSITFSDPVIISGNQLPAGTYGIHTIPGENQWEFIFSKDTKVNGSSTFNKEKEVLRVKAVPEEHHFMERMTFLFTDVTDNSAMVNLLWDKLKVAFKVETNTQDLFLSKAREQLGWQAFFQAAQYCLTNEINLEEALKWIEASCLFSEMYWNTRVKAQIQYKLGIRDKAIETMEKAIDLGSKMENEPFDFDSMKKMLETWKK
jgi:hypothetical protein